MTMKATYPGGTSFAVKSIWIPSTVSCNYVEVAAIMERKNAEYCQVEVSLYDDESFETPAVLRLEQIIDAGAGKVTASAMYSRPSQGNIGVRMAILGDTRKEKCFLTDVAVTCHSVDPSLAFAQQSPVNELAGAASIDNRDEDDGGMVYIWLAVGAAVVVVGVVTAVVTVRAKWLQQNKKAATKENAAGVQMKVIPSRAGSSAEDVAAPTTRELMNEMLAAIDETEFTGPTV